MRNEFEPLGKNKNKKVDKKRRFQQQWHVMEKKKTANCHSAWNVVVIFHACSKQTNTHTHSHSSVVHEWLCAIIPVNKVNIAENKLSINFNQFVGYFYKYIGILNIRKVITQHRPLFLSHSLSLPLIILLCHHRLLCISEKDTFGARLCVWIYIYHSFAHTDVKQKKTVPFELKIIYGAFEYAENRVTVQDDGFMNFQLKAADWGKRVGNRFSCNSVKVLLTPHPPLERAYETIAWHWIEWREWRKLWNGSRTHTHT